MSRDAALSSVRHLATTAPTSVAVRAVWLVVGSSLIGVAVALLVEARLGLAPYDVMASGISQRGGLSLGQASWVIAGGLILTAALLGRGPSRWSLMYVFLNGLTIDVASGLLQHPSSLALRMAFVPAGILVMAVGVNVVLHSGTTAGPFESLVAAGEDRGVSATKVRYGLDFSVLGLGLALGGAIGPATVVYGAFMGVTMFAVGQALADHRRGRNLRAGDAARTWQTASDEQDPASLLSSTRPTELSYGPVGPRLAARLDHQVSPRPNTFRDRSLHNTAGTPFLPGRGQRTPARCARGGI